jgi:hypothetical protein
LAVGPLGSKFISASLRACTSGGAPYCKATEVAIANMASTPRSVEPSLPASLMNSSPSDPSS